MSKASILLIIIILSFSACKKDNTPTRPAPNANFSLATAYSGNDTSQLVTLAAYDRFSLNNNSANANTYLWDFGNGTTSTDKTPSSWYSKPGTYTLTLTVSSQDGRKSVVTKTVKVLDHIAKQIVVTSLNSQSALGWSSNYPVGNKLNIWIEILQAASNQSYPLSKFSVPEAPLVYKTEIATNVDASSIPLSFSISNKLAIDMQILEKCCNYSGLGYIFNVYGQDNTGTYLLLSNYGSGISSSTSGNIRYNRFEITTGFSGTNLSLTGDYE